MFSRVEYAADEFRTALPAPLVALLELDHLVLCPGTFVAEDLSKQHTDLLYKAPLNIKDESRDAFIYLLLEHQSTVDWQMALRIAVYMIGIWKWYLGDHPHERRLPVILPLVLHHSSAGWTGPTSPEEMFALDAETAAALRPYLPSLRFILDDLSVQDNEALRTRTMAAAAKLTLWALKNSRQPGDPLISLRSWADVLKQAAQAAGGVEALAMIVRYILQYTETTPEEFKRLLIESAGQQGTEAFMTGAEQLVQQSRDEGRHEATRKILAKQLNLKFGQVPTYLLERIEAAGVIELENWIERFVGSQTLDEIFS